MNSNTAAVFGIRTIAAGVCLLGVGGIASLIWRRPDMPLWKWVTPGPLVATRPERYVIPERAGLVRSIFVIGLAVVVLGAVTALVAGIDW